MSNLVYRGDDKGDYAFKDNGKFNGTALTETGSVKYTGTPGTYEWTTPYLTQDSVLSVTVNYLFKGKVTMEISLTGNSKDYVSIVNGIPLESNQFTPGEKLIWKAALAPDSELIEVQIAYMDISGVVGTWGTPELSGFMFKKPIYILNPGSIDLFNYELPITIGESSKTGDCDVYITGVIQSDFIDVRWTQADKTTLLPYWREDVIGNAPVRKANFWVKIPHIPPQGGLIYLYYGKADAEDLSNGDDVFMFFDDFEGEGLNTEKWVSFGDKEDIYISFSDSQIRLDPGKITSKFYELEDAILEYRAKSNSGTIGSIIRGTTQEGKTQAACSSNSDNNQHCITAGITVKANTSSPILTDTLYDYRIIADGDDITFERRRAGVKEEPVSVHSKDTGKLTQGFIGLFATGEGFGVYYDWVRVRQLSAIEPKVDTAKTKSAQETIPNLPEFQGITLSPKGDIMLSDKETEGQYISQLLHSPFITRIMIPSWTSSLEGRRTKDERRTIDISAKEYGLFKEDCGNGSYYYSGRGDFTEGDTLRYRARFYQTRTTNDERQTTKNGLQKFSLDFRPGKISVISPNGRETLRAGAAHNIVWDASAYESDYNIKLEYSIDDGRKYQTITDESKNTSRYIWTVPDVVSNKARIKVSDAFDSKVYDISNRYFTIIQDSGGRIQGAGDDQGSGDRGQGSGEDIDLDTVIEEGERDGTKLYDVLIKLGDNTSPDPEEDERACYKEGDIVIVRPTGHMWSDTEKNSFLIVQLYLTEEEAQNLTRPKEVPTGEVDAEGNPIMETVKRRAKKINLEEFGLSKEKGKREKSLRSIKKLLQDKPLAKEIIEEKK